MGWRPLLLGATRKLESFLVTKKLQPCLFSDFLLSKQVLICVTPYGHAHSGRRRTPTRNDGLLSCSWRQALVAAMVQNNPLNDSEGHSMEGIKGSQVDPPHPILLQFPAWTDVAFSTQNHTIQPPDSDSSHVYNCLNTHPHAHTYL